MLVRKNKHIQAIAEYFMQHQIMVDGKPADVSLVSDEAFRLDASLAVRMIIAALRYLVHPDDKAHDGIPRQDLLSYRGEQK